MNAKLTNKELVQFAFITIYSTVKAEHPDFTMEQCEAISLKELNENGVKCHLRKERTK